MNGAWQIARYELARLFVSPLAWTILAVAQLLLGLMFALSLADVLMNPGRVNEYAGVTEVVVAGLFRFAWVLLLLIVPLLTMRLFSEERKQGSLDLLLASPVSLSALVLGKFAGVMGFMTVLLGLIALMPLFLLINTPLDTGMLAAGLLGLWLMMAAFTAAGLFVSSLTREPTIAAIGGFGLLLAVWLLHAITLFEYEPVVFGLALPLADLAGTLSLLGHFEALLYGLFDTADVAFILIFTTLFLALTVQRLDMER
jgi:ABC-2 type transport system permease protein